MLFDNQKLIELEDRTAGATQSLQRQIGDAHDRMNKLNLRVDNEIKELNRVIATQKRLLDYLKLEEVDQDPIIITKKLGGK